VVKSHGGADVLAFENAIAIAKKEVLADIAERIEQRVGQQLDESVSA
jgi:glycerol-3-phosphate acyltransferase PlsX